MKTYVSLQSNTKTAIMKQITVTHKEDNKCLNIVLPFELVNGVYLDLCAYHSAVEVSPGFAEGQHVIISIDNI